MLGSLNRLSGRLARSRDVRRAAGAHSGPDHPEYRAYVGPPADYDLLGGLQFSILFLAGLREEHRILDVGCGSLRAGRLLIPYLQPGNYYGVEPRADLVQDGIESELGGDIVRVKRPVFSTNDRFAFAEFGVRFDYVLAQSILSHTYPDLAQVALAGMADALADDGLLVATFVEGEPTPGSGWRYPETVRFHWESVRELAEEANLAVRRLNWPHPRQVWFAAAREDSLVERAVLRVAAPAKQPRLTGGRLRRGS